jgi:hypothetical protein
MRALRDRLNGELDEALRLLGDPPDLSRLPEEFWTNMHEGLMADLRPEIERMALVSAVATRANGEAPTIWDEPVFSREAGDWARTYTYNLVTQLTNNTRRLLQDRVTAFTETPGMTIGQLRDSLAPAFGERRALMIAITETTRAYTQGTTLVQQELAQAGIRKERIWRTSEDEMVCDICGPLADVPEGEGWTVGEPPAHPNCRCWVVLA